MSLDAMVDHTRFISGMICGAALIFYLLNTSKIYQFTPFGWAWVALLLQIVVGICLQVVRPHPNRPWRCLVILLVDFSSSFLTMGMGWALFGINVVMVIEHRCIQPDCAMSLTYGALVWFAGGAGVVAGGFNMAIAAKERRQLHAH